MLKFLADENFKGEVLRGILRTRPDIDIARVQDVGLQAADDPSILAWAADNERIVLSRDRATLPDFAYERVAAGLVMPGLFIFHNRMTTRQAIEELIVVCDTTQATEWIDTVLYFPL